MDQKKENQQHKNYKREVALELLAESLLNKPFEYELKDIYIFLLWVQLSLIYDK